MDASAIGEALAAPFSGLGLGIFSDALALDGLDFWLALSERSRGFDAVADAGGIEVERLVPDIEEGLVDGVEGRGDGEGESEGDGSTGGVSGLVEYGGGNVVGSEFGGKFSNPFCNFAAVRRGLGAWDVFGLGMGLKTLLGLIEFGVEKGGYTFCRRKLS